MDITVGLIKAVKEHPLLYNNNVTLEEREKEWLKISKKLQKDDSFLKYRWHLLRSTFQKSLETGRFYKYGEELTFLVPSLNSAKAKAELKSLQESDDYGFKPEFVITAKDLEYDEDDINEECDFKELQPEDLTNFDDTSSKIISEDSDIITAKPEKKVVIENYRIKFVTEEQNTKMKTAVNKPSELKIVKIQEAAPSTDETQTKNLNSKNVEKNITKDVTTSSNNVTTTKTTNDNNNTQKEAVKKPDILIISNIKKSIDNKPPIIASTFETDSVLFSNNCEEFQCITSEASSSKNNQKQQQISIVDKTENIKTSNNSPSNDNTSNEQTSSVPVITATERCEDVIFGELVAASLKKMSDDKKRMVKLQIMNALFS